VSSWRWSWHFIIFAPTSMASPSFCGRITLASIGCSQRNLLSSPHDTSETGTATYPWSCGRTGRQYKKVNNFLSDGNRADPAGAGSSHLSETSPSLFYGTEESGKSKGGGVCFMTNNRWCNPKNIKTLSRSCSPNLENLTISCRPCYLPREFNTVMKMS